MREIQIQFSKPGNWREFTLTAIYQDSDGYTRIDRYKQNDIPSGQAPALSAAVAVIADMEEDWQAVQVWARLGNTSVLNNSAGDDEAVEFREAVLLTIEAVNSLGGRRIFTVFFSRTRRFRICRCIATVLNGKDVPPRQERIKNRESMTVTP